MPITLVTRNQGLRITDSRIANPVPVVCRSWLTQLLSGEIELHALEPAALPLLVDRHPSEAHAIARSLAMPDLFVLDAADRGSRERVFAEVVRLAAERGESVLALSPDPSAADRLAESVASQGAVRVVRSLADEENPQRPSPAATRITSRALGTGRAEQLRAEAAQAESKLQEKLSRHERASALFSHLAAIERQQHELEARMGDENDRVRAEAESLEVIRSLRDDCKAALSPLIAKRTIAAAEQTAKNQALLEMESRLALPARKPGLFARLFGAAKPTDPSPDEDSREALRVEVGKLTDQLAKYDSEYAELSKEFEARIERHVVEFAAPHRASFEARLRELTNEAARTEEQLREFTPPRAAPDDTAENGTLCRTRIAELKRELAVAQTRMAELAEAGSDLDRRLLMETQVVIGTPGSLGVDPVFQALPASEPAFHLLVLDHAEELTEGDFERLVKWARRCLLAGNAASLPPAAPPLNGHAARRRPAEPSFLSRLARCLDREPWGLEGDRLVFRLVHLKADQRKLLAREPVLDHPHVELRLLAGEGDPVLAEIAFPAATKLVEAKRFLFSQLGEVLLRPLGEPEWREGSDSLTIAWPHAESETGEWIELEPGVRERVVGAGPAAFTAAIEFDAASGWNREIAEAWLVEHLPEPSASRFAFLARPASCSSNCASTPQGAGARSPSATSGAH